MSEKTCEHVKDLHDVTPNSDVCEECQKMGDTWVQLRLCEVCGHVGCCDSSKNKHATQHYHDTGHAVIKSFEPGQDWGYCYVDEVYFDKLPVNVGSYHH